MKLALIGKSIQHSKSPDLYKEMIGPQVHYDLLDYADPKDIPSLDDLAKTYSGINITAPYKEHFLIQVEISNLDIKKLNSINTISLVDKFPATNTDVVAAEKILKEYKTRYSNLNVILLGSGAMARMTIILLNKLNIPHSLRSRKNGDNMTSLDLEKNFKIDHQTLVINTCSRDYIFQGTIHPDFLFWDFNYDFKPHQNSLPSQVLSYEDGRRMLRFQAEAAVEFWFSTNPKLKC